MQSLLLKGRKNMSRKMFKVLEQDIAGLSTELQGILVDDLITAFQNRMNVLIREQTKKGH
jgi:hypothetical protein